MEKSIFKDGLFEFIEIETEHIIDGKNKKVKRKMVRRPPGVRALIINKKENKILLSKEFRYELDKWDYRLPGGKVFDSIDLFKEALANNTLLKHVEAAVPKEVLEEIGLVVKNQNLIKVSHAGSSVVWDLYYYEITDYEIAKDGAHLEENEFVDGYVWVSFDEIIKLCINSDINEDRTVGVLLSYIMKKRG